MCLCKLQVSSVSTCSAEAMSPIPTCINNMVQHNLRRSRPIPWNGPAEHLPDGKSPSARAYLRLGNTHEYFIKLLLFKYNKSRQNALLLLVANGDGTRFCWVALVLCVRQQSRRLQQHLCWVTAVTFNTKPEVSTFISTPTLFNTAIFSDGCYIICMKEREPGPSPALKCWKIPASSIEILLKQEGLEANVI